MSAEPPRIEVADNPAEHRFEVHLDGRLAGFADYHDNRSTRSFTHTEIAEQFEGHGLAGRLVRTALDDARQHGRSVLPYCPFVRSYIASHPAYLDLVPVAARAQFELDEAAPGS